MKLVRESVEDTLKPKSQEEINKDIEDQIGPYRDILTKTFLKKEDKIKPEDIIFSGGASNDMGYGAGSGNPKLSYTIKGIQPRWKALYRGDDEMGHKLMGLVTDFLNDKKTKEKIAKMLNDESEIDAKYNALFDRLKAEGLSIYEVGNRARNLINLSLRYIK